VNENGEETPQKAGDFALVNRMRSTNTEKKQKEFKEIWGVPGEFEN
jgi:hypothetical protein